MSDITKELDEIMDGRRSFTLEYEDERVEEYFIGTPTADDVRQADWENAKTYNKALKEGVFTQSEMLEILKSRNIVGPDYEQTGEDLKVQLAEKVVKMETETDREKRIEFALEVASLREEVFQWNQRLTGPMATTCESIASDARVEYLTSCVIQDKEGNRIWEDFDSYRKEKNLALQTKSRFEVMLWLEGLESDFLEKSPENMVLQELFAPSLEGTDSDTEEEEAGESEEEAVDVVEEKPAPKKKGRKPAVKKAAGKNKAPAKKRGRKPTKKSS